jgi:NAD(P)-dependent dehydrogenase (short-subunit alcohol dehydrogenase family)
MRWSVDSVPDQAGRAVVVTGATSGLGLVTTEHLARRGAHVVMAVRDEARGRRACDHLAGRYPGTRLDVRRVDLADLDTVRDFADGLHRDGFIPEVLVNNAGVMATSRRLSPQGHEMQFATNHLGHFALTGLLLPDLRAGKDPRVVTVSSTTHRRGRIRFHDLTGERGYWGLGFYAQSKLANVLFGLELHRRLRAAGSPVRSLLAHPGYAATNLPVNGWTGVSRTLARLGNRVLAQDATTGALPQLYAAVDPQAQCGQFIGPDGILEGWGRPRVVRPGAAGVDREAARRLWEISEELTGVRFDLPPAP